MSVRSTGISVYSLAIAVVLLSVLALPWTIAADVAENRPNIVLFLVDDMGLMDTSVPMLTDDQGKPKRHPLNDWYRTPNIAKLAEAGVRFSNFYAHSVCSPTRCSIITGQNSARHRTTTWVHPQKKNKGEFQPPEWNWEGPGKKDLTLPRLLQRNGYHTIHIGKAHFGPKDHEGADPLNLGFDRNIGGSQSGNPPSYYARRKYGGNSIRAVPHLEAYHDKGTFLTEALTLEANKEIVAAVKQGKPFFLHMSHYAVHAPFDSDPRFADHYENSDTSKQAKAFATLVEGVDKSLGDIIMNLKRLGVAKDTLLIFLGDNGSASPLGDAHERASSAPLLGKKGTHHEGGVRVPFICAWAESDPGNPWQKKLPIAAGTVQSQMGTITDLMPTVCALMDVAIPADHPVDGFDLKLQLNGKVNKQRSNTFLNHFPHKHASSYFSIFIQDHWKVAYHYPVKEPARYELFNLKEDPYEMKNLADTEPARLKAMIQTMNADLESKGSLFPIKDGMKLRPVVP